MGNWSSDAKTVFVTLPRRDFTVVSDMDFARNPTGNNRDVFRDPAGGPLTSTGHLRDSATSRQRSRSPFARECRYTSRAVISTFQKRWTMYLQWFYDTTTIVNLLIVVLYGRTLVRLYWRDLMNLALVSRRSIPRTGANRVSTISRIARYVQSTYTPPDILVHSHAN